ncbi:LmbU family transcriptional regulator [Streptomyces sp. NBC_00503]|uniref:LmbU family transcriptional regulator n=1 Tax=Streptomyces sp. NBC_00503 TaxID=2903659 RepID=UPI002E8045E5|nr:LmbU family transcriptional regulator [Streptomyces sp. NBC_00503]WUD84387.1 LmbU family transcriptional regulator [Streptomyces sp. NBC_00503]
MGLKLPDLLAFEEWERAGRQLAGVLDSSAWWLGDWLTYGKDHFSDRYQQGIQAAGLQYQTLRNYAWVTRRFEQGRRHARLTFQHHAEVASLSVAEQDTWLSRAEELSWTTKQLRNALREARGAEVLKSEGRDGVRRLAVPRDRFDRWLKAAERSGAEVDEWVLSTLDSAAELVFGEAVELAADETVQAGHPRTAPQLPEAALDLEVVRVAE